MNKFIITSSRFNGEINVLYGLDSKLLFIDFLRCELTDEQRQYFKDRLSINLTPSEGETEEAFIIRHFGNSRLDIVKEGYRVTFEQWWNRYNIKHNKDRCIKLWNKLSEADKVNAFFKLALYERHLSLNAWKTKADPDTYLRNRYWESEWK